MNRFKRITVKIGSNVLTRSDGTLDVTRMSAIVDQVAELYRAGIEVILVSSGAVASGRSELKNLTQRRMDSVDQRQLFSAVGQAKLINRYYELFRDHNIAVGQVLTMKENFATRRHYLNQRNCMMVMLDNGVIPIVNENDTVSVTELMFTDNDELSGLIASMMDSQALVILSNVDGIYSGTPGSPGAEVIAEVEPDRDLSEYISTEKSGFGRGGMITKCGIARKVADEGIEVIIAKARQHPDRPHHGMRQCGGHTVLAAERTGLKPQTLDSSQFRIYQGAHRHQRQRRQSHLRRQGRQRVARGHNRSRG